MMISLHCGLPGVNNERGKSWEYGERLNLPVVVSGGLSELRTYERNINCAIRVLPAFWRTYLHKKRTRPHSRGAAPTGDVCLESKVVDVTIGET